MLVEKDDMTAVSLIYKGASSLFQRTKHGHDLSTDASKRLIAAISVAARQLSKQVGFDLRKEENDLMKSFGIPKEDQLELRRKVKMHK